jgi:hypothetical protein
MNKISHIISLIDDKDMKILSSLLPTSMFGGQKRHINMLDQAYSKKLKKTGFTQEERNTMSELFNMIERYIVIRAATKDQNYTHKTLLKTYREQENEKLFVSTVAKVKPLITTDDYIYEANRTMEEWQYGQLKNRFANSEVDHIIRLDDIAIIVTKLKQIITLGSQASLTSREINLGMFALMEEHIQYQNLLNIPVVKVYYYIYKFIFFPQEESWFITFSEAMADHENTFDAESVKAIYFHAINYCIRRFNSGDKTYGERLLTYYQDGLQKQFLLTNGYLSRNTYRNINTVAIRLGRLDTASNISATYAHLLRPEDKETAYHFNFANIYYAQKDYDAALTAIQSVNFDDHLSNLFAKTLLLKIYFEKGADRLLDSHLDAMQVYLLRQKILGYHKTNYSNIIKYTRRIIKINPHAPGDQSKLIAQIKAEPILTDREWLVKQVEERKF